MKKFKEWFLTEGTALIIVIFIILIISAVSLGVAWLIAESDMPEWVKFWLLR